ncbi:hypothetical protein ACFLUF_02865 [Chloroflexota bacterium]
MVFEVFVMGDYKPSGNVLYSQSLDSGLTNQGSVIEPPINKYENGFSRGKTLLTVGAIALVLVLGAKYGPDMFGNDAPPIPYTHTPPASTAPLPETPTDNLTTIVPKEEEPKELTLEETLLLADSLAPKGVELDPKKVGHYTEQSYVIYYNEGISDKEKQDIAIASLNRVIKSVAESNDINQILEMYIARSGYLSGEVSNEKLIRLKETVENHYEVLLKNNNTKAITRELESDFLNDLGHARGL